MVTSVVGGLLSGIGLADIGGVRVNRIFQARCMVGVVDAF